MGPVIYARSIESLTADQTVQMISQVERNIEFYLRETEKLISLIREEPGIQSFFDLSHPPIDRRSSRVVLDFLSACVNSHPEIAGIMLVNARDEDLSNEFFRINRDPLTDEPWYGAAAHESSPLSIFPRPIGRNIRNRLNYGADDVVAVAKPVRDLRSGAVTGVILIDLHLNFINDVFANTGLGRDGVLFISDSEGGIVYTQVNPIVYRIPDKWLDGPVDRTVRTIQGSPYQVLFKKSEYSGWKTVGVFSLNEALQQVNFIRFYSVTIGGVTVALAVVLSFIFASSIAGPVINLKRLMGQAEAGDLSVRFGSASLDEIGQLGRSFNTMIEEIQNLIKQVYREQQEKREAELRILQEQIKPHFLYNTLDTIQWMAQEHKAQDIVAIVGALTNLFRVGLSKGKETIRLKDEIRHVESYLFIQKARYEEKFDYAIRIDPGLESCLVIKLILQPLVENAIYHGVKARRGRGFIQVLVTREDNAIRLSVHDDGVGMTERGLSNLRMRLSDNDAPTGAGGYGAYNVHQRVRLSFGAQYGLSYESVEGQGTTAMLIHPIIEEED